LVRIAWHTSDNDLLGMMDRLGNSVHSRHLGNAMRESNDITGSFHKA